MTGPQASSCSQSSTDALYRIRLEHEHVLYILLQLGYKHGLAIQMLSAHADHMDRISPGRNDFAGRQICFLTPSRRHHAVWLMDQISSDFVPCMAKNITLMELHPLGRRKGHQAHPRLTMGMVKEKPANRLKKRSIAAWLSSLATFSRDPGYIHSMADNGDVDSRLG